MITSIIIVAIIGFCIALYTFLLEKKVEKDPTFKPVCDISDKISCTKPMKSQYANLFYVSNTIIAMIFYSIVAALAFFHASYFLLGVIIAGCIISCVLAYLLYFKIQSLCLLCTAMYIVNLILLVLILK